MSRDVRDRDRDHGQNVLIETRPQKSRKSLTQKHGAKEVAKTKIFKRMYFVCPLAVNAQHQVIIFYINHTNGNHIFFYIKLKL
jgi:hypothetical protein